MTARILRPYALLESASPATRATLRFWCPGCQATHEPHDGPNGWTFDGNFDRPTLVPSVLVHGVRKTDGTEVIPNCHSFVRAGRIEFLGDCTHRLAGQTVDLPEVETWPEWARETKR